jgi:formylglycine-generating enzyme required for sulfatase activity
MSATQSTFGHYRLLRELGRGGEATVHLAEDLSLGRQVAIKIFPPHLIAEESPASHAGRPAAEFARQLDVLARLNDPGICALLDAGEVDGVAFLVMAYIEGRTLAQMRTEDGSGRVDEKRAVRIALALAKTLAKAHEAGIVHGDLAPRNILVTKEDQPILLDFGVSSLRPAAETDTGATRVGGTLPYLAPERRHRAPDVPADIFGLAAVLFELVAGQTVFSGPTRAALMQALATREVALLRSVVPSASRDLEAVLAKALQRERGSRYLSMSAFAADLERLLVGQPVSARRYGWAARVVRYARQRRAAAGLIVAVGGFLLIASPIAALKRRELVRNLQVAALENQSALESAAAAQEALARHTRLADLQRLRELEQQASQLVPPTPSLRPALQAWLERSKQLAAGLEGLRDGLIELRTRGVPADAAASTDARAQAVRSEYVELASRLEQLERDSSARKPLKNLLTKLEADLPKSGVAWAYVDSGDAWQDQALGALVANLERFTDPSRFVGLLADVEARLHEIDLLEQRQTQSSSAWQQACASIADERECPPYQGLRIKPQFGLVPLRRDPASGLWEFLHVLSGEAPQSDAQGAWQILPETGIVLVFIPGGNALIGAQRAAVNSDGSVPGAEAQVQAHLDPQAAPEESPLDDVPLEPFLISKFELTEAQWLRLHGDLFLGQGRKDSPPGVLPVSLIDWQEAHTTLQRGGLELPTEVQWEYAARAGTSTPWWTGSSAESLAGAAVFSSKQSQPVGTLRPNAFGLHDVAGNVSEWCRDVFARYEDPRLAGSGARQGLDEAEHRIRRGGGYPHPASELRSARRSIESPAARLPETGVRPARRLEH